MQKRGQIYLLVALIMGIVIFGLVTVTNVVQQESLKSDFEKLSSNYALESSRLINSLIIEEDDAVAEKFINFSKLFTSYSKTQSPQFGLIYALNYEGTLYLGNYLKTNIIVEIDEDDYDLTGCYDLVPAKLDFDGLSLNMGIEEGDIVDCVKEIDFNGGAEEILITIADVPYTFTIKENKPEVIMVSWEERGLQRKVFTEGDLNEE